MEMGGKGKEGEWVVRGGERREYTEKSLDTVMTRGGWGNRR